mmetsp:Transcript_26135/g.24979  ORF Transcript_26135/g.24979 Transcript_26135/m.24979 type:complete len:91 (+) Transcript_26135:470-742(+)
MEFIKSKSKYRSIRKHQLSKKDALIFYMLGKSRLDEEYEHLLGNIDSQREKITLIDSQIKNVLKNKEEEDNTMRELERSLVEILVGQQKN